MVRYPTLLRQQRRKEMINSPTDDLDINGRKSGKSSSQDSETTETANTKSVLKAVMLMKRSRGSIQIDKKIDELESNSSTDQKNETKSKLRLKRSVKSAPNVKYRTVKNLKTNTTGLRRNKQKQLKVVSQQVRNENASPTMISSRLSTSENIRKNNGKRPMRESCRTPETLEIHSDFTQNSLKSSSGKNNAPRLNKPIQGRQSSSPAPYVRKQGPKHRADLDDRWVAGDKKFKVKKIVNTRIPGRENTVDVYQRFEPSMFAYIDTMNNFEKEKAVDPFGAKLKAKVWLRQAKERLASGGSDYNPGQSPIIVIEELCAQDEVWDGHESDDQREDKDKMSNYILETLLEDSDKENVAEEVIKFG